MSESFEKVMEEMRGKVASPYWKDMHARLQRAHEHEMEAVRDPQRIGGTLERDSFEYAIEQLREFRWQHATNDDDATVYINNVARAHEHDMEQLSKSEYARGYMDGQRSMDAEHRAVALRLRALPLDEDSHGNLNQIARALYHSDWGWTQGACRGLRDELIRLLGGVHDEPVPVDGACCSSDADCVRGDGEQGRVTYDALGNERHKAVCRLRKLDGCSPLAHGFRDALAAAICVPRDGAPYDDKELCHLICDRLIHLLGGDEPTLREIATELSQASADAMSNRAESDEGGEATITDELVKYAVDHANDPKGYYEFANTDVGLLVCISQHIDAKYANLMAERDKLLRKFDILKEHGIEVVDAVAGGYEIYSEDHGKVDQLKYERDKLQARLRAVREAFDGSS